MQKYQAASETAKSKGDDRKARMHQRIVKVTHTRTHTRTHTHTHTHTHPCLWKPMSYNTHLEKKIHSEKCPLLDSFVEMPR